MNEAAIPAPVVLLMMVFFSIFLALPLGSFLLFSGRKDDKTRLWLMGIVLLSGAMLLIIVRPFLPVYLSHQLPWVMTLACWLISIELFRRERGIKPSSWIWTISLLLLWGFYQTILYREGETEKWGLASHALIMSLACGVLGWNLVQLNRQSPSKNLLLIFVSVLLYSVPNIIRVLAFILTGNEDVMNVFKFSWQANLLSTSYVFAMMAMCFGYWGFTLEKSERERKFAIAGEDVALESAGHYKQLVQERDHLLVMNSRFSALSALSSFSAMLIHDISQPLQSVQFSLERIRAKLNKGLDPAEIFQDLNQLGRASDQASHLIVALRNLIRSAENVVTPILVKPLFVTIQEILSSESLQRNVLFSVKTNVHEECAILCEPTMLQRIVINMVSNSLNQFQLHPAISPDVCINLFEQELDRQPGVTIEIIDNGGGFPSELLGLLGQPWSSKSPDGMGLALALSKQLITQWGGRFELQNRSDGITGALVRIWLQKP